MTLEHGEHIEDDRPPAAPPQSRGRRKVPLGAGETCRPRRPGVRRGVTAVLGELNLRCLAQVSFQAATRIGALRWTIPGGPSPVLAHELYEAGRGRTFPTPPEVTHNFALMQMTAQFLEFQRDHEALNKTVKGLEAVMVLGTAADQKVISSIVSTISDKWRSGITIEPTFFSTDLPRLVAGMSMVHAAALFEEYIRRFEGLRGSRGYKSRELCLEEKKLSQVEKLFLRTGWRWPTGTDSLLRVHLFYRLARNCAAHSAGAASSDYAAQCVNDSLQKAWEELSARVKGQLPSIPKCNEGEAVPLSGVHVIMFSTLNLWLAKVIEECFVNECAASNQS